MVFHFPVYQYQKNINIQEERIQKKHYKFLVKITEIPTTINKTKQNKTIQLILLKQPHWLKRLHND